MVHTLPVKGKSAMLNIAERLGIRNARRNGLRPYRTRNNSRGSSAEETAAGQRRRLAGHDPVSITGRRPEPGVMVGAIRRLRSPRIAPTFGQWSKGQNALWRCFTNHCSGRITVSNRIPLICEDHPCLRPHSSRNNPPMPLERVHRTCNCGKGR